MNLILLSDPDFITPHRVRLTGRRFAHIQDILKAERSQQLTVGKINGLMGQGEVKDKTGDSIELEVKLDTKPPEALPLTLILALPRPPMLKRILFSSAQLGVKKIIIFNFNRVEKSFWNSSALKQQAIEEQLILGLEQAKDTVMPEVIIKKGFKSFVQDELPALIKGKLALVAHPGSAKSTVKISQPAALIIGPEGGIIDYEIELLKAAGCQTIDLGPRILRTEYVLPYVVGRLFYETK
jgi:16S rRNA (uracil1498-N3)-methyltransferase